MNKKYTQFRPQNNRKNNINKNNLKNRVLILNWTKSLFRKIDKIV